MQNWATCWATKRFKNLVIIGVIIVCFILISFPFFFNFIEKRNGIILNDFILNAIPSYNVSIPIFTIIWVSVIISIKYLIKNPAIFITFLWAYIFFSLSRMITITTIKLNPPNNLIPLIDPLSNAFYGGGFITKDLFYSGHTGSMFLIYLCMQNKPLKLWMLIATILVGIMVLVQHVHYTIDVVAAPLCTYLVYKLAVKFVNFCLAK